MLSLAICLLFQYGSVTWEKLAKFGHPWGDSWKQLAEAPSHCLALTNFWCFINILYHYHHPPQIYIYIYIAIYSHINWGIYGVYRFIINYLPIPHPQMAPPPAVTSSPAVVPLVAGRVPLPDGSHGYLNLTENQLIWSSLFIIFPKHISYNIYIYILFIYRTQIASNEK